MNEELQRKYLELQMINQNFQQIQEQITILVQQMKQLENTGDSLESLEKSDDKNPILVPLGGGLFAKSNFSKKEDFLLNVGSGVLVEKSLADSKDAVRNQIEEIAGIVTQLEVNLQHLSAEAQHIQEDIGKESEGKKQ